MKKFSLSRAIIPNSFTAGNLLSGFVSMIFAAHQDYHIAAIFIFIGAFFDATDGIVARLVGTSSQFGVELDSLADIVTFGVAPAFLIYKTYLFNLGWIGMLISAMLLIFGAFRLARFNVQIEDLTVKIDFRGLPIPMSAIVISCMVLAFYNQGKFDSDFIPFIIPTIVLLSLLMVSNIPYSSLSSITHKSKIQKFSFFIVLVIILILVILTKIKLLFYLILLFILIGLIRQILYLIFHKNNKET